MSTVQLPAWIYLNSFNSETERIVQHEHIWTFVFDHMVTTEEGGLYTFYKGVEYPEKFAVQPEDMGAANLAKAYTVSLMGSVPIRGLEKFLWNYCKMMDRLLGGTYRRPDLYCVMVKELRKFIFLFLRKIGISFEVSYKTARAISHLFEIDIAYRYPIQDILTETYQGKLRSELRPELRRLLKIFLKRCLAVGDINSMGKQVEYVFKALNLLLLIPKYKRAFIFALDGIDLSKMQFDVCDRFHCMLFGGYNYFGLTIEQRAENYKLIYPDGKYPQRIKL